MCPQPTAGNVIKNAGFDTDLSSWTVASGDGSIIWAAPDATSCPFSGSAFITSNSDMSPRLSQCIQVTPTTSATTTRYYWGLRARGAVACDIDRFFSPNCTGTPINLMSGLQWINVDWSTVSPAGFVDAANDTASIRFSCYMSPDYPGASGYLDKFYFSTSAGEF